MISVFRLCCASFSARGERVFEGAVVRKTIFRVEEGRADISLRGRAETGVLRASLLANSKKDGGMSGECRMMSAFCMRWTARTESMSGCLHAEMMETKGVFFGKEDAKVLRVFWMSCRALR